MLPYLVSSKLRRRLLAHYFTHSDEKYYVREIAALLNLDPGNLSREFRKLTEEGLFLEERKGRIKLYRLNSHYSLYQELKQIIFKTEGVEGRLKKLVSQFPEIHLAFVYGSYAEGKEKASSDVDLVLVGTPDRKLLTSRIRNLEDELHREINFNLYTRPEFMKKSKEKGNFLAQVVAHKKILLKGNLGG